MKITWRERLRYRIDRIMSKGPIALIEWLFIASLVLVMLGASFVMVSNIQVEVDGEAIQPDFLEVVWMSLMRALDPGTVGGDTGWGFRFAMLSITIGGIFVVGALIGVLTNTIDDQLRELRKGRSMVIERDHTVILGWAPQIFSILSELVIANQNQPRSAIAVLAVRDKVQMEDEIKGKVKPGKNTEIICRSGNPIDLDDLAIVNPYQAKAIIVLSPDNQDPDTRVIKTLMALTNNPDRRKDPYHIVAEIRDPKNLEAASLVGKEEAQLILTDDLIARIAAQTCRQSGLSSVYTELLDFSGDEIYFHREPELTGSTFGEALLAYEDSALIGLCRDDNGRKQRIVLLPPLDTRLESDDQIIAISEDDDTIQLSGLSEYAIDYEAIRQAATQEPQSERTLILGWNRRAPQIIHQLDSYVAPGSEMTVVSEIDEDRMDFECRCSGLDNQGITFLTGDTTNRRLLNSLQIPSYQHIIILSYADILPPQEADAHTLVTLLHLRDISDQNNHPFSIVSEMLDIQNRELAEVTRVDDFIVSDKLVSLLLSQVSENRDLKAVFDRLFSPEGAELYLKPAGDYVQLDRELNFYTVVEAARQRNEIAIGYKLKTPNQMLTDSAGIRINPNKSRVFPFHEEDRIIVLAVE
jgi:voltage-gated potassium channel Kch